MSERGDRTGDTPDPTAPDTAAPYPSRRRLLGLGAGAVVGGAAGGLVGGGAIGAASGRSAGEHAGRDELDADPRPQRMSLAHWSATRGKHYLIAHRGSGDVLPEHSMEAYDAALQWGARALEISVGMTSDGVLICMHDATFDRTTTITGRIADQPSTVLRAAGISQPQLGPAWVTPPLPRIPLFTDVLQRFGGRAVLCVEPKDDDAYGPVLDAIERFGLQDTVIVKLYYRSRNVALAAKQGRPIFSYLDSGGLDEATIAGAARALTRGRDYLVLPTRDASGALVSDSVLRSALTHQLPVWVYPVHRRSELEHFFSAGVSGAVCSSYGYLSRSTPVATSDTWSSKAIASGELTVAPGSPSASPSWTGQDQLTLDRGASPQFLCLGQFGPVTAARYSLSLQVRFDALPAATSAGFVLAFGHADDAVYELRDGRAGGYHVVLRGDGTVQLFRHDAGRTDGVLLGATRVAAVAAGTWTTLTVAVTPTGLTVTGTSASGVPAPAVVSQDATVRGGYVHVGRADTGSTASLSMRRMTITRAS